MPPGLVAHAYGVVMHYETNLVQPMSGELLFLNFCSKVCASVVPFFGDKRKKLSAGLEVNSAEIFNFQ